MLYFFVWSAFLGLASHEQQSRAASVSQANHFLQELYFYPIATRESLLREFDPDQIVKDATVNFPRIDEMSGVSIIVYWAQLCPRRDRCDFSMIDQILEYWGKLGKKVVLCVATTGAPIEKIDSAKIEFVSATPDWVLREISTFQADSNNFIGAYRDWSAMANNPRYKFNFPRYDDRRFLREVKHLVRELGNRYDGNPAIAYMRIGTGKSGEDNPSGRIGQAWFTNHLWIEYSRKVEEYYLANFRKTHLEFDVLWMTIVAAGVKNGTPITSSEQKEAQRFIDDIVSEQIFIAYNGVGPRPAIEMPGATAADPRAECAGYNATPDNTTTPMDAAPYSQIERLRKRGVSFGLEGNALSDPCMYPGRIAALLDYYKPARFIFFGDAAALINFQRQGINDKNSYEVDDLVNVLVPWTNKKDSSERRAQAMSQINAFGTEIERLVRERVAVRQ